MLMPLTAFAKRFILGFWQGSEYSSAIKYISMEANLVNKIWWAGRARALSNTWREHGWGPQEKGKYIVKYLNRSVLGGTCFEEGGLRKLHEVGDDPPPLGETMI